MFHAAWHIGRGVVIFVDSSNLPVSLSVTSVVSWTTTDTSYVSTSSVLLHVFRTTRNYVSSQLTLHRARSRSPATGHYGHRSLSSRSLSLIDTFAGVSLDTLVSLFYVRFDSYTSRFFPTRFFEIFQSVDSAIVSSVGRFIVRRWFSWI